MGTIEDAFLNFQKEFCKSKELRDYQYFLERVVNDEYAVELMNDFRTKKAKLIENFNENGQYSDPLLQSFNTSFAKLESYKPTMDFLEAEEKVSILIGRVEKTLKMEVEYRFYSLFY